MKGLTVLVVPAILLVGLILFGLTDTGILADEVTTGVGNAANSSAGATITTTMYAVGHD